ncbi:PilZ domain-containing protein [Halobacillus salinarum]|uniref:PilZ domain-containing protein n=1 Tax=Halobacillus salinarum TaxID=2932257 RepID=A0ABY4ETD4_9BACI|nr:PilZ domain-containing protein [Halobacillus salinarum]UOQ45386.1 PilZ domain-containing protein [Halobacillus salinarum]
MVKERRNEPFRYSFDAPLHGYYNKKFSRHVSGPLQIVDMSLNGLRFSSEAHPGLFLEDEVFVSFILDSETFTAEGRVIWKQEENGRMTCGMYVSCSPERLRERLRGLYKESKRKGSAEVVG